MLKRLKPLVFLILDGFGHASNRQDKAIALADTLPMSGGGLPDLAPMMPAILGVTQPIEMSGKFLLKAA